MNTRFLPIATTLLSLPLTLHAASDIAKPLRTAASSPFQSTRLSTQLESAFKEQQSEFYFTNSASSIWAHSDGNSLDYYQSNMTIGMKVGTGEKFTTGVEYQYTWANNNELDSLVMNFHDLIGVGQNGRDEVEEDGFHIASEHYGVQLDDFEDESLVKALKMDLQYHWHQTETEALSISGLVYFNQPDQDSFISDTFEYGVQINYSKVISNHSFHSTLGVIKRSDDSNLEDLDMVDITAELGLGYVYRLTKTHHFIAEYYIFQGALDDGSAFSKPSQEVTLGYRYNVVDLGAVEFSTTENIGNMDNSTDIMFTLGFRLFI